MPNPPSWSVSINSDVEAHITDVVVRNSQVYAVGWFVGDALQIDGNDPIPASNIAVLFGPLGCSAPVINAEQESLKNASGSDPAALDILGDVLENTGEAVGAVRLRDPELKRLRDDYRMMAHDLATASRQTAQALRGNDPNLAAIAAKKMSSFGRLESVLVDDINRYCSGSADDTRSH